MGSFKIYGSKLTTAPCNLSQYTTSFISFQCQGIRHTPLNAWFMHRKKFCVGSNFVECSFIWTFMIIHLFEQSDIDIDNIKKVFTNKITKCFLVEMAGSNRWPPECKSGALPAGYVPKQIGGPRKTRTFGPTLTRVCSNQLSYRPLCRKEKHYF